jgi:hypothetical protein
MGILIKRRKQLDEILKKLPKIELELERDQDTYYYRNQDYEIYINPFSITTEIIAKVTGFEIAPTYYNPPEFYETSYSLDIFLKKICENESEIFFNKNQILRLEESIKEITQIIRL